MSTDLIRLNRYQNKNVSIVSSDRKYDVELELRLYLLHFVHNNNVQINMENYLDKQISLLLHRRLYLWFILCSNLEWIWFKLYGLFFTVNHQMFNVSWLPAYFFVDKFTLSTRIVFIGSVPT